eukprot:EG_transcript_25277
MVYLCNRGHQPTKNTTNVRATGSSTTGIQKKGYHNFITFIFQLKRADMGGSWLVFKRSVSTNAHIDVIAHTDIFAAVDVWVTQGTSGVAWATGRLHVKFHSFCNQLQKPAQRAAGLQKASNGVDPFVTPPPEKRLALSGFSRIFGFISYFGQVSPRGFTTVCVCVCWIYFGCAIYFGGQKHHLPNLHHSLANCENQQMEGRDVQTRNPNL